MQKPLELLQRVGAAEFGESCLGLQWRAAEELVDWVHGTAMAHRSFQQQTEAFQGL